MTSNLKLKETYDVESKYSAFYTGGNVELHSNNLLCQKTSSISVFNIENGRVTLTIGDENTEDADTIHTFTSDGDKIITSHKSGLLKMWNSVGELEKMWRYIHKGPIAKLNISGNQLASGGSDGCVRIWDLQYHACVSNLKGCQGVVNVVEFDHENVYASGDDGNIVCWRMDGTQVRVYNGHFSKVTCLSFCHDGVHFVSSGRDKVVMLWTIVNSKPVRMIPVLEVLESVVYLPQFGDVKSNSEEIFVAIAGDKGIIRVWDVAKSKEVFVQDNSLVNKSSEEGGLAIVKLLYDSNNKTFIIITADQNIIIHNLKTFECEKQFVGFSDEILDVIYVGKNESHLAVATNSVDIKLYENTTMNCRLLKGHTDLVLALNKCNKNPDLMLSSSKDNTIRLWLLEDGDVKCVGWGMRHTGSVGSVAFSQLSAKFAVSVSQDSCVKVWEIPKSFQINENLNCLYTEVAHQKDINCVTVSPNDKIIATGSQDKTAKLFTENLTLLGVLRGHKRGVWCVRFSPTDQVVLTSSADCTIKLWSIVEMNCLKTFQGHESSVLRIEFVTTGMQFLSAGADGLIKLFNLKTSECISTLDEHDGRIWALALAEDESQFVTGGSDSTLIRWKDVTEEKRSERMKQEHEMALQDQKLQNYLQADELLKALKLSLTLERPHQTLKIVQGIIKKGESGLADTVHELRDDQKESLLKIAANWNVNSKNCQAAQLVFSVLLNELQMGKFKPVGLAGFVEQALPYTERHFKRLTQLMQNLHFINYTINCIQPHAKSNNFS